MQRCPKPAMQTWSVEFSLRVLNVSLASTKQSTFHPWRPAAKHSYNAQHGTIFKKSHFHALCNVQSDGAWAAVSRNVII